MTDGWPGWKLSRDNVAEIARYVSPARTRGLVPLDCLSPWDSPRQGLERGRRLYNALLSHRIIYAMEPFNPNGLEQRIRGPEQTIQGPATCLDLALVLSGMAIAADMRPLVAIRTDDRPHALVVLDIRAPISGSARAAIPPWFIEHHADSIEHPEGSGVWHLDQDLLREGRELDIGSSWLIIDAGRAARQLPQFQTRLPEEGAPFHAVTQNHDFGELGMGGTQGSQWSLVDITRAGYGWPPYIPPSTAPPIHSYLPAMPAFRGYPSRAEVLSELRGIVGLDKPAAVVVLHAPSGYGKSMLAHRLAQAAGGCGWFLNATDDKVLTRALAEAERQEKALQDAAVGNAAVGEKADAGEDKALASAALERLRDTDQPWAIVLDNCNASPHVRGLRELVPRPRSQGQFVLITTTHAEWKDYADKNGWQVKKLRPLKSEDLDELGLPRSVHEAVGGQPLVAQALEVLQENAVALPENPETDGLRLVWDLVLESRVGAQDVIALARLLAWCPPEPMSVAQLLAASGIDPHSQAGVMLARTGLVNISSSSVNPSIQMHGLFAETIRTQTWRDSPAEAARAIWRLLASPEGRNCYIDAADATALERLEGEEEPGEAEQAAAVLDDPSLTGMLLYGLGHVRERRGPVAMSGRHFRRAAAHLDQFRYPYEVAESLIGRARIVFHSGKSTSEELAEARNEIAEGRGLLDPLPDVNARQLSEQANALSLLILQKLVAEESDLEKRKAQLLEIRESLWLSYIERLRIAREGRSEAITRDPPADLDGLGAERAYYNLAGSNIHLAKVNHALSMRLSPSWGTDDRQVRELLREAQEALDQAEQVYAAVRGLRENRYSGRAHPHLAACIQGQATVAYFRAVLLGEVGYLVDSVGFTNSAMEQRIKVASGLAGPGSAEILDDIDVGKSLDFAIKIAVVSAYARKPAGAAGSDAAMSIYREAADEWLARPAREEDLNG